MGRPYQRHWSWSKSAEVSARGAKSRVWEGGILGAQGMGETCCSRLRSSTAPWESNPASMSGRSVPTNVPLVSRAIARTSAAKEKEGARLCVERKPRLLQKQGGCVGLPHVGGQPFLLWERVTLSERLPYMGGWLFPPRVNSGCGLAGLAFKRGVPLRPSIVVRA